MTNNCKNEISYFLKNYFIYKINTIDKKQKELKKNKYINLLEPINTYIQLKKNIQQITKEFNNLGLYTTSLFLFFDYLLDEINVKSITNIDKNIIIKFISNKLKKKRYRTKSSYVYTILNFLKYLEQNCNMIFNLTMKDFKSFLDNCEIEKTKMTVNDILNSNINIRNIINLIYTFTRNKDGDVNYNKRLLLKIMFYGSFSVKEVENIKLFDCYRVKINDHICIKINLEHRDVYIKYSLIKKEFEYSYINNECKTNNLFYTSFNKKYSKIAVYKLVNRFLNQSNLKFDLYTFYNYFPIYLFNKNLSIETVLSILGYVDANIQTLYLNKKNKLLLQKQVLLKKYN